MLVLAGRHCRPRECPGGGVALARNGTPGGNRRMPSDGDGTALSGTPAAHWFSATAPAGLRLHPPEPLARVFAAGLVLVEGATFVVRNVLHPGTLQLSPVPVSCFRCR